MKSARLPIIILILLITSSFVFASNLVNENCQASYRVDKTIQVNQHLLKTEVASTPDERTKGLGGRACINPDQAMLFIFNKAGQYHFWMKDMRFPIDIIWLSSEKKVVYVKSNVPASTYPQTFVSNLPAQYVLELKAGQAQSLGIKQGTTLNF